MTGHPARAGSLAECLELLDEVSVGRLVFTVQALPAVAPVYFSVVGEVILIPTEGQPDLAEAVAGSVVAFAADRLDPAGGGGWSVTLTGVAALDVGLPRQRSRRAPSALREAELVVVSPRLYSVSHIQASTARG